MSDLSFQNNVPDPLLSGKELPSFKFELEKSKGKVLGNSFGKEATIEQLPISKGIAGVSMQLEPGVMRELHWHATAAEWRSFSKAVFAQQSLIRLVKPRRTTSNQATSGTFHVATLTCLSVSVTNRLISF